MRKDYDPAIAVRLPKDDYIYLLDLAKRRSETMSEILRYVLAQFIQERKKIDLQYK